MADIPTELSLSSWDTAWNTILRNYIFADAELKALMKIPNNTNIITFIDRYFIRAVSEAAILTDEPVRIIYDFYTSGTVNNPHMLRQTASFDIYVKTSEMHNVGVDRLVQRIDLISNRLKNILMPHGRDIEGYKFSIAGDKGQYTSMVGYSRHNLSLYFIKTY